MLRILVLVALVAVPTMESAGQDDLIPLLIGYQTTIQSQVLGEARDIFVYLPANYGSRDDAFPVMLLLDARSSFHHTTAAVDSLSRLRLIPEMIVVGIPNTDRTRDFSVNQGERTGRQRRGGADAFLDFIEQEVLVWVDDRFRTVPHRTMVGHSLGASLACYTLATRPHLFQSFVLHSPAISGDERRLADGEVAMTQRVRAGLGALDDRPRRVFATMSGVEAEEWIQDWKRLRRVFRSRAPDSLELRHEDLPEESHASIPLVATVPGLRWLFEGWDGVEAAQSNDIEVLDAHYEALSQRMGYPVSPPEELVNAMGYRQLQAGQLDEALAIFRRNVELYPESANVHDSLGEGLEAAGDLEAAAESYAAAVERAADGDPRVTAIFEQNLQRVTERLAEVDGS
jgi:predicted alpha/beta superfamily hydrolase